MGRRSTHALAYLTALCFGILFPRTRLRADSVQRPFAVEVVDDQTGRGVPLVELETVSRQRYWTDSAGVVAVNDPALRGRRVFFTIRSHGYEFPADAYGSRGVALDVTAGATTRLKIKRLNAAERLYRVTGEGIYQDSVLTDRPVPIRKPLLNAEVVGQDSVQSAVYRGKIHWFWGDTSRQSYPLGHFGTAGATSELPGQHALGPGAGVDLDYFTAPNGFSRPTIPHDDARLYWLDGLTTVKDAAGAERLIGVCSIMKSLDECAGRRLVVFNDQSQTLDTLADVPPDAPLYPRGQSFHASAGGVDYLYFATPFATVRVRAEWRALRDWKQYEAFTCLVAGGRYDRAHKERASLDRKVDGTVVWAWMPDTAAIDGPAQQELVAAGLMRPSEGYWGTRDAQTREPILLAGGSVQYNAFRRKWVMIAVQSGGRTSYLGEIYYAEADRPEGPWPWARKIVTHDHYSFYNPAHHPFFDEDGGKVIYFEGTYSAQFSRDGDRTPRYDYNQMMYRLDLSDPRLKLPANLAAN